MQRTITPEEYLNAVVSGDLTTVQRYLAAHAGDPEALNVLRRGSNALMLAIRDSRTEIALELIAGGIPINWSDSNGHTALILVTNQPFDNPRVLRSLLANPNIEVNAQSNEGRTALMNAVNCSLVYTVASLLLHPSIDLTLRDSSGQTAIEMRPYTYHLHQRIVSMFNDREYTEQFLNNWVDPPEFAPLEAFTPEEYLQAVINGDIDTVQRYLAENAGDVNAINVRNEATTSRRVPGGMTPLMIALYLGNIDIARQLIVTPGIDVNARHETDHRTTLMFAVTCTFHMSQALLELPQINVNAQDIMGCTALMIALESMSEYHIAALLLHPGIDITLRNNDGQTAMDCLEESERNLHVHGVYLPAPVFAQTQERFARVRHMFIDRAYARVLLDRLEELRIEEQSSNPLFELMQGNTGREMFLRILEAQPPTPEQLQAGVGQGLMRESFINAVNAGNREAIEEFIRQNNGHPGMVALGEEAALIAQNNRRPDLAGLIMQLTTNDAQQQQPVNAAPAPLAEPDQVDPNSFEGRLEAIGFDFDNLPVRFKDPVHLGIIENPMVVAGGQTLDRPTLQDLINRKRPNPVTRQPLHPSELERSVSYDLKAIIEEFVIEQETKYRLEQERIAAANREQAAAPPPPPQENTVEESPELSDRERIIQARLRKFGTPAGQEQRDDAPSSSAKRNLTGKE